jgi:hypothetical protein
MTNTAPSNTSTPSTRRSKVRETLIALQERLNNGHIVDLMFSTASPEYIKQEFYRAAKEINFPITVTLTANGIQIRKRVMADLDFNITTTSGSITSPANREPEPNDLD